MEVNVYFNGPATEIDMGPREFSVIPATGPGGADGQPGRDGTIENLDVAATTLPAGSQATASYENNLLTLGIPQGDAGRGIVSITKQSSSGLVDTYKITYTSGATSTFTVTNGQNTSAISINRSGVAQGWTSSTWSYYAQNAGAPSGGTCYYTDLTVDGVTKYDTFVPRYMRNFTGTVYVTVFDGQIRVETSVNVIGQYWINGAIIRGNNNTQNNTTIYVPGGGGGVWGNITGTLSNQSDLQTALNAKADASAIPTKVSDLTNDAGYITQSYLATQDISSLYTFTKTAGNAHITDISAVRMLKLVNIGFTISYDATTAEGQNVIEGTLSGGPLPATNAVQLAGYLGMAGIIMDLRTDGTCYVKTIAGAAGAPYTRVISISFLTND